MEPLSYDEQIAEWEAEWDVACEQFDFITLAQNWHDGQWSGFYKLQCNGRILDYSHATDCWREARAILRKIGDDHEDYEAMNALEQICDDYPNDEDDDEE